MRDKKCQATCKNDFKQDLKTESDLASFRVGGRAFHTFMEVRWIAMAIAKVYLSQKEIVWLVRSIVVGFNCTFKVSNDLKHIKHFLFYRGNPGGISENDCQECPPGYYCGENGLSEASGQCAERFICTGGAKSPTPQNSTSGHRCPEGGFCQSGALSGMSHNFISHLRIWPVESLGNHL